MFGTAVAVKDLFRIPRETISENMEKSTVFCHKIAPAEGLFCDLISGGFYARPVQSAGGEGRQPEADPPWVETLTGLLPLAPKASASAPETVCERMRAVPVSRIPLYRGRLDYYRWAGRDLNSHTLSSTRS